MPRLILFGGLRLEDENGPLTGRAAQKRRLALLALLGAPPARAMARERVLGYVWPETAPGRARHSLSTALSDLRKELGDDLFLSHGDEIALNPGVVSCDAIDFLAALESGATDRALELYQGPFMDGFFLHEGVELERWVESERQRYSMAYREALEDLAERMARAGDLRGAVDAWRRLANEDPYNARIALGYMRALEAAGDRPTALQFARVHETLLQDEFGAEPNPEVIRLARELREAPRATPVAPKAGPAPDPVPDPVPDSPPDPPVEVGVLGPSAPARRRVPRWAGASALALLAIFLVSAVLFTWTSRDRPLTATPVADSVVIGVAVLPFENVGGAPETEYFADGLTEEILNALANVPAFRVPARSSSFVYKDRAVDVREVGRQLDVEHVVEGSVRKEGDRLRIAVTLVDAGSGYRTWSDTYNRRMGSVFETQEEIARAIAETLRPRLAGGDWPTLKRPPTRDPEAYEEYLRGRQLWFSRSPAEQATALVHFGRALQHDSTYALAYSGIADVYNTLGAMDWGALRPADAFTTSTAAAERAVAADPDLGDGHAALATALFNYHWDWPRAEREFRRALDLSPGYVMARHWYSLMLLADGRPEDALEQVMRARELEPSSAIVRSSLARHYYYRRDLARSAAEFRGAIQLDSELPLPYVGLGMAAAAAGDADLALKSYRDAERVLGQPASVVTALVAHAHGLAGDTTRAQALYGDLQAARGSAYVAPHILTLAAIGAGRHDEAVHWLEEALEERSAAVIYARLDPIVDVLRSLPRFQDLMRRVEQEIAAGQIQGPATP